MPTDQENGKAFFSAMTLNLRFGLAEDGPNDWVHRKAGYPHLFRAHSPDFIGMQEVNPFQLLFLDGLLADYDFIGRREDAPPGWQDNPIFYRKGWRCVFRHRFFLSHTPDVPSRLSGSKWPRQCVMGIFERGGKTLAVVNTHMDFAADVQEESAHIILRMLREKGIRPPTILLGDFNAQPHSPGYRVFTAPDSCDPPFRDVFEDDYSFTFHDFTGEDSGGHIDWMLYRGGIEAVEKKIIRERFEGLYPSDHFPVMASFRWNGGG